MDIQGFNNYLIYPDGRVYNKKYERFVKTRKLKEDYEIVSLFNIKKCFMSVSRLVAKHFIPNPDNLPLLRHKDGNTLNNHMNNLEWVDYHVITF